MRRDSIVTGFNSYKLETSDSINNKVYLTVSANFFQSRFNPRPGIMHVGDNGLEYIHASGVGFIQIPYAQIKRVYVKFFMKKFVQQVAIETKDLNLFFSVSHGKRFLKSLAVHVGRDKIVKMKDEVGFKKRSKR